MSNPFFLAAAPVDCIEAAIQKGGIIEQLMTEILGPGWILNNLVGNACGKDLQPQALHCGQSMVPKPWPEHHGQLSGRGIRTCCHARR